MDYLKPIYFFNSFWASAMIDVALVMSSVMVLIIIAAVAQYIFQLMLNSVSGQSSGFGGTGTADGGSFASTYDEQYDDSVAGTNHRAGSKYVRQEGYEASKDDDGSRMGSSESSDRLPYQAGPQYADKVVQRAFNQTGHANGLASAGDEYAESLAANSSVIPKVVEVAEVAIV